MASLSLRPQGTPLRLLVLAMLAVAVSGCIPRGTRPTPPPPVETGPAQPQEPSRLPPDETRNRVAVLVPLSGANAALGQSLLNAANLALFDTGGERIRITAYDTGHGAAAAANEALADGSGLILGPLLAQDVRAVAPIAARRGVPVIAFSNDDSVAGDGVYLMGLDPGQSVRRVVAYARSRGAQRFAAIVPTGDYGQRAGRALTQAVEGAGASLVGIQTYERNAASLRAAAARLTAQGRPDAILVADGARIAVQLIPTLRAVSPQPRILGTELWATEGNLGASPGLRGAWFAAPSDGNFAAFSQRYRARYNARPFRLATLGYDAVLLTVRIAADWPIGRRFPERALRDAGGFVGVDGAFRFGRNGVAERALEVREVGVNGASAVSPAPRGFN
jgi:ABC-type branched-subunit amino acid transport system substrate-binding protein